MSHLEDRALWNVGPPRLRYEEAALDLAASASSDFAAIRVLTEAVQSRRTTARRMAAALSRRRRSRRRAWLASVLADVLGVVYRDAQYDDLLIELDGRLFHNSAAQRDRDLDRDLDAAVERRASVRLGYGQVFDRPCHTAARIATLLVRRGWAGPPVACGPTCVLRGGWLPLGDSEAPHNRNAG
jgi:hypothetical protein